MEEIVARAVQVFLALAGGYLIVLWFALVVWTYRDIGSRSNSVVTQVFATLLSLLFFIPGTLLYMLMRPRATLDEAFQRSLEEEYLLQDIEETSLCPSCQRQVSDDYILCPHCQSSLKHACTSCSQLIKNGWPVCPYCGSEQSEQAISIRERVDPPAERYLERGSRTFRQVTAPTVREIPAAQPALDFGYRLSWQQWRRNSRFQRNQPLQRRPPCRNPRTTQRRSNCSTASARGPASRKMAPIRRATPLRPPQTK